MAFDFSRVAHFLPIARAARALVGISFQRLIATALAMLFLCATLSTLQAQEPTDAFVQDLNTADIESRLAKLDQAGLDDAAKAKALQNYQKALENARTAASWKTKATEFEFARHEAPQWLEDMREEIAQLPSEPTVQVPEGSSLAEMEQLQLQSELDTSAAQRRAADLDALQTTRANRRVEAPKQITAARERISEITAEFTQPAPPDEPAEVGLSRRWLLQTRKAVAEWEIAALEKEILSYDARGDLLAARREMAARQLNLAEKTARTWQQLVHDRRMQEAQKAAIEARKAVTNSLPALKALAEENARLAERRSESGGLVQKINKTGEQLEASRKTLQTLKAEHLKAAKKIETIGLTTAVGFTLRKQKQMLPDLRARRQSARDRQREIAETQFFIGELEDMRNAGMLADTLVEDVLAGLDAEVSEADRAVIAAAARELYASRAQYVDQLLNDYELYFPKLADLDAVERDLIAVTQSFSEFIDKHILWTKSTVGLTSLDAQYARDAWTWLLQPKNWRDVLSAARDSSKRHGWLWGLAAAGYLIFLFALRLLNRRAARDAEARRMGSTLEALAALTLEALRWPALLVLFIALMKFGNPGEFATAFANAAYMTAFLAATLTLFRRLCVPGGVGEARFHWAPELTKRLRRGVGLLTACMLPAVFLVAIFNAQNADGYKDSLGRYAFLAVMASFFLFAAMMFRPGGLVMQKLIAQEDSGWLKRMRYALYFVLLALPVAMGVIASMGYYYTAIQLTWRFQSTLWLLAGAVVLYELGQTWLQSLAGADVKPAAQGGVQEEDPAYVAARGSLLLDAEGNPMFVNKTEDPALDAERGRHLLQGALAIGLVVALWLTWVDVLPALGILDRVELWTYQAQESVKTVDAAGVESVSQIDTEKVVTLADAGLAVALLALLGLAAGNIPGLIDILLLQRVGLDGGMRYAVTAILQYLLVIAGFVLASGHIGLSWSNVQWLAAAVSVGLGFGLQEIFANFVSGLIILFEQPVRVGDIVTVSNVEGVVKNIRMRATTVQGWDRKELVVPNKDFVTGQLINWTLTDPVSRVIFPVGVAYGTDVAQAMKILLQVARNNPIVMKRPEPSVIFRGFNDSALDLELRVFSPKRDYWPYLMNSINLAIYKAFKEAGIEIAFPQLDLHFKSKAEEFERRLNSDGLDFPPQDKT